MAGMLPGVELARRRRIHHHQNQFTKDSNKSSRNPQVIHVISPRIQPSSTMDEAALRARRRLEEKLRGPTAAPTVASTVTSGGDVGYRRRISPNNQGRTPNKEAQEQGTDMKFLRLYRWSNRFQRQKSQKEVCAICLDEFQSEQPVLNLPCFHRYHSKCLLPWLTTQSHCPYCRTHFQSP